MVKKKEETTSTSIASNNIDDFTNELIKEINKKHQDKIAFNLGSDAAPTNINRWISTGSRMLDAVVSNTSKGGLPEGRIVEIQGPPCHAKGMNQKVLLSNGEPILVDEIKVGMKLLGPDGKPRKVLEVHEGTDKLYKLIPKKGGKTYVVNQHHRIHLKKSLTKEEIANGKTTGGFPLPVKDYIHKSKNFKKYNRQVRASVETFERNDGDVSIPPYILGLLLGDGHLSQKRTELTSSDLEVLNEYSSFVSSMGYEVSTHNKKNNQAVGLYHKNGTNLGRALNDGELDHDKIRTALISLGLLGKKSGDKFVPNQYKFATRSDRLALLAGLIDTDGSLTGGSFEITTKSNQLAEDIAFVANSLGFFASVNEKFNKKHEQMYWRVCVGGKDLYQIPTRLSRKQMSVKKKWTNSDLFGFEVEEVGTGEFIGFEVDGDNKYLTDDFTVFYNSIGKSHIGFELAKSTQRHGGIVVYIDTENATSLDNLRGLGIKVNSQFVFVQTACTEEIFEVAEQAIMKARQLKKDVPVTIIWDSVAASSPKAELEGDYDQNSIGLQARVLGKGLRKITQLIANQKVLFVLFNQQRQKIGVMYGDPTTTPGGAAIPYACSTRIRLYGGSHIQDDKTKEVIGIAVKAKTIKNKVARPFREAEFEIHFGVGVREDQQAFDALRRWCDANGPVEMPNGEKVSVAGTGAWKTFIVTDAKGNTVVEEKWQGKADFGSRVYYNPQYEKYVTALLDASFIVSAENDREHPTYVDVDTESYEDFRSLASS